MLRITIELIPWGLEHRKKVLHIIEIYNDATGTASKGNYVAKFSMKNLTNKIWKITEIKNFPRLDLNSYDLLYRALRKVVGKRNHEEDTIIDSTEMSGELQERSNQSS